VPDGPTRDSRTLSFAAPYPRIQAMPYEWLPSNDTEYRLHAWPHRSLTQLGFVWFLGITAFLIALPIFAVLGSPVVWALLPFIVATVAAIWLALRKNGRDRSILEELVITPTRVTLARHGPAGRKQEWEANPHWLRVTLHEDGGPVPNYLTLKAKGREVELGAFLAEEERKALHSEVKELLLTLK
jgi:uncharacterized membrane protein